VPRHRHVVPPLLHQPAGALGAGHPVALRLSTGASTLRIPWPARTVDMKAGAAVSVGCDVGDNHVGYDAKWGLADTNVNWGLRKTSRMTDDQKRRGQTCGERCTGVLKMKVQY
jgi:hypothetical protein